MVADQRLGGIQLLGQMGDAQLLGRQQLDDPPAQRVAQRPGQLHRQGLGLAGLAGAAAGATVVAIWINIV